MLSLVTVQVAHQLVGLDLASFSLPPVDQWELNDLTYILRVFRCVQDLIHWLIFYQHDTLIYSL